jgi:hypothetical protein
MCTDKKNGTQKQSILDERTAPQNQQYHIAFVSQDLKGYCMNMQLL